MGTQLHNELKKEFQLERMILFSDAVFAIAITLLVIEIKIPEKHENTSDKELIQSLGHLIPKFVGFIVSFMLIGLYWILHHRMFGFVTNYNRKLLVMNLGFLFFVALMPFSTGFYSEYGVELYRGHVKLPFVFYVLNFFCLGLMNHLMWRYIINPKNELAVPAIDKPTADMAKVRSLTVPLVFLAMLPVAYMVNVKTALYMPVLIPAVLRIANRKTSKKNRNHNIAHK